MGMGHIWGDEGRRNIRGREGWVGERYAGGRKNIKGRDWWEGGPWGLRHCQGMKPLLLALNEASSHLGSPITP